MRTSLTKILGGIALLASTSLGPVSTHAQAAEPFRCEPGELYAMNVMVSGVEYWFPVYEMFKQAAKQMGCDTIYTGTPDYDVTKQIASFDQILARQPKGIMVHPMNSDPFIEPINRAISQGTAIVTFAADSPNSDRTAFITSNNTLEGTGAADAVAEAMGGKGEYAVLENPGQDNHDLRISSFIGRMEEKWPDMKLVARAASNQDPNKAYQAVLSMAQANPDLGAVFMPEANSALGAAQASVELGGKIKVMTADVNAKILDMIKAGEVFGSINPNQGMQGYIGFITLFLAAHPDMIDPMNGDIAAGRNPMKIPYIDNGYAVVTADNADSFYWDAYLKRRGTKGIDE
ncbi:MAG: substrate-binding domain-containing protein [Alphaproteobacteria bacterium]|nr:substrate-binding domain-containing protein [Alphaproteobacteria bacterium]MBU0806056.1 substrate-binding domain-containing protein [Alphaproteobacteria bacterium]MBU0873976.1 substrate-binding domain-containing protein [Alphaproteobacteria bacterium]MBU1402201.1 substrate-binding domain-containing protein [Alphaproteobacteria bacterium]MBU1590846.1 substrate-binding domain-containing protein [Alphaproteobacteria bacterium]